MTTFTPHTDAYKNRTVYFEDSQDEHIPGYTTSKTSDKLQGEIIALLQRMGADSVAFSRPGTFAGEPPREGYEIMFQFGRMSGKIACAALPIKSKVSRTMTQASIDKKKAQALKQSLYLLRDQLQAALYTSINKPAADTLIPYLITDASGRTITEVLIDAGSIPMLPAPRLTLGSGR